MTSSSNSSTTRIPKTSSSVHDISAEKPPFGSRFLTDEADVWSQNAWDHVPPPIAQDAEIAAALTRQKNAPVPEDEKRKYNEKPARHWDNFYKMNSSNFFKNRKWLHLEFPELLKAAEPEAGPKTIVEIGCGAGNAVFPLLSENRNPLLKLHAYDYSSHAVKLVQTNPLYLSPPVGSIHGAVWDLSSSSIPADLESGTADMVILVFVLSALHPQEWQAAISNIHKILKPGGLVLLRDYGRHDLTQLRFKGGRLLEDNFYIRGDKTRVYFLEIDELALLFTGSPAPSSSKADNHVTVEEDADDKAETEPSPQHTPPYDGSSAQSSTLVMEASSTLEAESTLNVQSRIHPILLGNSHTDPKGEPSSPAQHGVSLPHPLFGIEQLGIDRRLLVNRKRQIKMYRVWMQAKFRKLEA